MSNLKLQPYWVATKYAVTEQARNRFALTLIVLFIPTWVTIINWVFPADKVAFKSRADDVMLSVSSQHISLLTGGLNAVTLIVGFMVFTTTRRTALFERRLIFAGYGKLPLILAKLVMLVLVAVTTAGYATLVLLAFWDIEQILPVAWSLMAAALAYGGIGIVAAVVLPGDLEGMFAIIMVSLVDTIIQNPIGNPMANKDIVRYFPTYGPMQLGVSGGFTDTEPAWEYGAIPLIWLGAAMVLGLVVMQLSARAQSTHVHADSHHVHADSHFSNK